MSKFGARTREKNARALEQLEAHGTKVSARIVDVSKEENIVAGVAATLQEFGRIDSCFANAGVSNRWKSFLDIGGDNYRRLMSINLDGVVWTLREACRHMKARAEAGDPGGSIVTIASMGAIWGSPRSEDYSATKAAVIAVTNGIAVEFALRRARKFNPSGLDRDRHDGRGARKRGPHQECIGRVPYRRWGKPEEFGGVAVYLASDASSFHNGDSLVIDGGYGKF